MVALQIRQADSPQRPAIAWLLTGDDPRAWLAELSGWGVPHKSVTLYVVPTSPADRRPRGALATVNAGTPCASSRVLPYGCMASRLFLPVDAVVVPPIAEHEAADLIPDDAWLVWHPSCGLVRMEAADRLLVADLIDVPPRRESLWNAAQPGVTICRRLSSVEPDELPTVEQILASGRGNIGSEPPSLRLPRSPEEPRGLKRLLPQKTAGEGGPTFLQKMMQSIAQAALKFTSGAPQTASSPTWINSLENWANGVLNRIAAANPFARLREVQRLLNLLESDPMEGLRYAIPLGGGEAQRGVAPPSNQLGRRDVDFNLGRLGGSRPADFWDLPDEFRVRLQQKYRQLALREASLGRHRRAAYIYAELLGDYAAAATTLAAGKHFREAAVLYRERLRQPLQAARCLEQGGLLTEAAALFEEFSEFESAGDIHRRLEDPDEARRCYLREQDKLIVRADYLSAARLTEAKLHEVDRALELLHKGWTARSSQMQSCLGKWFESCGKLGRHEAAAHELARFRREEDLSPVPSTLPLANVLADASIGYPDATVREQAASVARVVVSRRLAHCKTADAKPLIDVVKRMVAEDRLLTRDGERYIRDRESADAAAAKAAAAAKDRPSRLTTFRLSRPVRVFAVRSIPLSPHVEWTTAAGSQPTFYAAGWRNDMLVVARGFWEGSEEPQMVNWRPMRLHVPDVYLAPHPRDEQPLLVHVPGQPPLIDRAFAPVDRNPMPLPAGSPPWSSERMIAMARDQSGTGWGLHFEPGDSHYTLSTFGQDGSPLSAHPVLPPPNQQPRPALLHIGSRSSYIALGNSLLPYGLGHRREWIPLPGTAQWLAGSPQHTRERLAVMMDAGGLVCLGPDDLYATVPFAEGMTDAKACFTMAGWLVAVSATEVAVYRVNDRTVVELNRTPAAFHEVFAVLPTPHFGQFAVFSKGASGANVGIWQITGQ